MTHLIHRVFVFAFLAASILVACRPGSGPELPLSPPQGLEVSWFHDDCGPADGPALTVYLGQAIPDTAFEAGYPHLRVTICSDRTRLREGESVEIRAPAPGGQGDARYCLSESNCRSVTGGSILFSRLEPNLLEGGVEVLFTGGEPIRGMFSAPRLTFQPLCG